MTRKILRELKKTFPGARIETTNGNHYAVHLPGGGTVIISNSPSTQNFMRNAIADARRQSRQPKRTTP